MIYGEIKYLETYKGISKHLDKAIDYILSGEYKNGKFGKNVIDGETLYFNCPENAMTKSCENAIFEGHKRYIDIHIVVEGEECIAYTPKDKVKLSKEYDLDDDYELYEGDIEMCFTLDKSKYLILFPNEPHIAMLKVREKGEAIKKVIFKVLVD